MTLDRGIAGQQFQDGPVRLRRALSCPGQILVQHEQPVRPDTPVAQRTFADEFVVVDVGQALHLKLDDTEKGMNARSFLHVTENDYVEQGSCLAERLGWRGWRSRKCLAPVSGRVAAIVGHQLLIEIALAKEVIKAFIPGKIVHIEPDVAATVETFGSYFQAIFGIGGEAWGTLLGDANNPQGDIEVAMINQASVPSVLFAGRTIKPDALSALDNSAVSAIIVGSLDASLLDNGLLPKIPIVVTEGFGQWRMQSEIWQWFVSHMGDKAYVSCPANLYAESYQANIIIPNEEDDGTKMTGQSDLESM